MTPEGALKHDCKKIADAHDLMFRQVEGKAFRGWPDTAAGKWPKGSGVVHIEFKRPGEEPTTQQWKRINEINAAGGEAWWCDSIEGYKRLIGL